MPSTPSLKRQAPAWAAAALVLAVATGEVVAARKAPQAEPRAITPRGALPPDEQAVVGLFESSAPSVAYITTEILQPTGFFTAAVAKGAGSGFVWDADGHVVTNNHVVEGARSVFVQLDAGEPIEARIVGAAPDYDLAVVRLTRAPRNLRPIPLGSSRELRIGQSVYAIGNPFGLQRTLTRGIVSALGRELPTTDFREFAGVIQTDAAINPGNSGGPLLDSAGRLIGVNTAIYSPSGSNAGIGFAIPVDIVNRVVPELIKNGRVPTPGIGIVAADEQVATRLGVEGVVVVRTAPGSPAERAGLRGVNPTTRALGDVIVGVDGQPVHRLADLTNQLEQVGVGKSVELALNRNGSKTNVKVEVTDVTPPRRGALLSP